VEISIRFKNSSDPVTIKACHSQIRNDFNSQMSGMPIISAGIRFTLTGVLLFLKLLSSGSKVIEAGLRHLVIGPIIVILMFSELGSTGKCHLTNSSTFSKEMKGV
jgi:hypothetical protein